MVKPRLISAVLDPRRSECEKKTYEGGLWRKLERVYGGALPQTVRAFLAAQHGRALVEDRPRKLIVQEMLATLANLETHDLWPADQERRVQLRRLPGAARRDGRWPLWRELHAHRELLLGERHDEPWTALRFGRHRKAGTIVFSFDRRLSDKTVKRTLRRELPRLRAAGWSNDPRPLSKRELALVRYVCLDSPPEASWRERTRSWRRSRFCRSHPAWAKLYRGKRATQRFERDFHKAEASLAGRKGALDIHYDPRVRERELRLRGYETQPAPTDDAAARRREVIARVDPAKAAALRAGFTTTPTDTEPPSRPAGED